MNIITFLEITNIIKYITYVNTIKDNLDIDFIDNFIEYADKDEYYIRQYYLDKYSFLSLEIKNNCKDVITQYCKLYIQNSNYNIDFNNLHANFDTLHVVQSLFPDGINKDRMMNNYKYYLNPSALKIFLEIFLLEAYTRVLEKNSYEPTIIKFKFRKYIDIVLLCDQKYEYYQNELYNYYPIYKEQINENKILDLENKILDLEKNYNINYLL